MAVSDLKVKVKAELDIAPILSALTNLSETLRFLADRLDESAENLQKGVEKSSQSE